MSATPTQRMPVQQQNLVQRPNERCANCTIGWAVVGICAGLLGLAASGGLYAASQTAGKDRFNHDTDKYEQDGCSKRSGKDRENCIQTKRADAFHGFTITASASAAVISASLLAILCLFGYTAVMVKRHNQRQQQTHPPTSIELREITTTMDTPQPGVRTRSLIR